MSRIVKASLYFCDWSCENTDTRRFPFEEATFAALQQKLVDVFHIKPENTTVTWIDADGDRITISSDEELADAFSNAEGPVLKLHVKTSKPDTDVSMKCPWAWMFQPRQPADDGDHDATEKDGDHDDDVHPNDPRHFWDGNGCPLGFKHHESMGNSGFCCPLRNAACPIGFGRFGQNFFPRGFGGRMPFGFGNSCCPMGFGGRMPFGFGNSCCPMGFGGRMPFGFGNSCCPMGFGGRMPFGFGNSCCPMGFGRSFGCPMKGYGMFGGNGCPLGFKPGSSGCPLRNCPCPMKAMQCCPAGFKPGESGCPMRKYSCPMGFGKGKCSAKKEETKASAGED